MNLRRDLTLGNGATMVTLYDTFLSMFLIFSSMEEWSKLVLLFLYLFLRLSGFLIIITLSLKPFSILFTELSTIFKNIVRVGIPRQKIREAIMKAHGVDIDNLK